MNNTNVLSICFTDMCIWFLCQLLLSLFSLNLKGTSWISRANSFYDRLIDGLIDWVMSLPVMKWWLMFSVSLQNLSSTPPTNSGPPSQRSPMLTTSFSGWVTEWWMSVERSPLGGRLEKGLTWRDNYTALVRGTGMHCSDWGQPLANQPSHPQLGQQ